MEDFIKKRFINDLINELENLELPPEWRPKEVIGLIIKKIEDKGRKI